MSHQAISIDGVTKTFRIYREEFSTLKERVLNLGKVPFSEFDAIHDISFDVPEGSMTGILGHNGSGKSTLLKCIAGTLTPTVGKISVRGRMTALLELGAGFHPELTGRENLYLAGSILGLSKQEIKSRLNDIVEFAELEKFIDTQMKHYSSGMFARLGFALAANVDPEVLLIDEVLAVGDEAFQLKCLNKIRDFSDSGVTMLFVTHDVDLASSICDELVVLNHGQIISRGDPRQAAIDYRRSLYLQEDSNDPASVTPTDEIRIVSVSLESKGRPVQTVQAHEPVALNIVAILEKPVNDLVIAYAIKTMDGGLVHSSNTELLNVNLSNAGYEIDLTFNFENLPLLEGIYEIDVGAHSLSGSVLYAQSNEVKRFTLTNPSTGAGMIDLNVRAEINSH
ncbi:MAG: ABC transporter ATP-binding protein [Actinobacteria bacterium]|nr:ABC transporter ATP-binding protein [Actinomycetota bacterium]|tara:strand:+ start:3291 stop:4475 length:1185 start_codon:yes stop_codon:yes gene_type:complete